MCVCVCVRLEGGGVNVYWPLCQGYKCVALVVRCAHTVHTHLQKSSNERGEGAGEGAGAGEGRETCVCSSRRSSKHVFLL